MSDGYTFYGQPTGTTAGTVAAGDHTHDGGDVATHSADTTNVHGIADTAALALTGHTHAGADVDSGTVAYARLPTGTASSTVAIGDHTHTALAALSVAGNTVYPQASIPADRGYIAWSMPTTSAASFAVLATAGTLYLTRIYRVPAGTVTNIVMACTAGGGTLTTGQCFAALFTSAGALVAQSVDQAASWATSGMKTMALSSPQVVTAGDYYAGVWFNGTTGPTFTRFINSAGSAHPTNTSLASPNLVAATANTGLTTSAPSPSFGAQSSFASHWWVALS